MCNTKDLGPRLTVDEINAFNPSPENPLEVECDDGEYTRWYDRIKIISAVATDGNIKILDCNGNEERHTASFLIGTHYPSIKNRLGFQVGDEVSDHGVVGEVYRIIPGAGYPVEAQFKLNGATYYEEYTLDGRLRQFHKEPSLKLIKRPAKKVKKKFYQYIYKTPDENTWKILTTLLDSDCKDSDGNKHFGIGYEHKRIEESCQELEVDFVSSAGKVNA